jgi:hypothetical protein
MKLGLSVLAVTACIALAPKAQALPISGSYTLTVATVTADTVDLSMASQINFSGGTLTPANVISTFTPFSFTPATVTACFNCGTINNIIGIPAGAATTPFAGTSPLFTVNGLSFSLTGLTQVLRTSAAAGSSIELKGTGLYSAAGFDNTAGTFDITIQNGSATIQADSASASGNVSAIPEPASLALLGGALATVGFARRRKNS